jgi:hypothetical protein
MSPKSAYNQPPAKQNNTNIKYKIRSTLSADGSRILTQKALVSGNIVVLKSMPFNSY